MHRLLCRWVPGTLDRVKLQWSDVDRDTIEMTVGSAARVLGRRTLDELYLKGSVRLTVCDETFKRLSNQEADASRVKLGA